MAARRLVLNGLTAEVEEGAGGAPPAEGGGGSPDSLEFYHELELYRQLLALPPANSPLPPPPSPSPPPRQPRRATTPDPPPSARTHDEPPRRSRTPGAGGARARAACPARAPPPRAACPARYLGSFPVGGGELEARGDAVSSNLQLMKESGRAVPVLVVVALSGVKVCDPKDQSVRMSHALRRISYATCESARALFAVVAREPRSDAGPPTGASVEPAAAAAAEPARHYCHAFETDTPEQAEELNSLVGDAFRMAFASQLQPSAPLWCKELGSDCDMGVRAPDTLPGLTRHYPHCRDRSPAQCDIIGVSGVGHEASPSSSEESHSPTEMNSYRRLGEGHRAPLIKRLAMGLSAAGALLHPSDDDSTPLVTDTPTTPTNLPLCLNGGYINEGSEAEARTRESNRENLAVPLTPRRNDNFMNHDLDVDFRRCNNVKNSSSSPAACSRATSSSSGASSCGAGGGGPPSAASTATSGNNNTRHEPDLRHAPWFQHGIPREIALEVLSGQPVGAFLVRGSTTQAGCFALSLRVPRDFTRAGTGIAHYLIMRTAKGYKIKGFTKEFRSLCALVTHHSVMPELLPVPLRLPRALPLHPHSHPHHPAPRADHADIDALHQHQHQHQHHHLPTFLAQLDV